MINAIKMIWRTIWGNSATEEGDLPSDDRHIDYIGNPQPLPGEIICKTDRDGNTLFYYSGSTINAPVAFIRSPGRQYTGGTAIIEDAPIEGKRTLSDRDAGTNKWLRELRERGHGDDWEAI